MRKETMKTAPIHDVWKTGISPGVDCPHCNLELILHSPKVGATIDCPNCQRKFRLRKNPDDMWNKYTTEYKPIKRKSK